MIVRGFNSIGRVPATNGIDLKVKVGPYVSAMVYGVSKDDIKAIAKHFAELAEKFPTKE